jgi:hypothetical protein
MAKNRLWISNLFKIKHKFIEEQWLLKLKKLMQDGFQNNKYWMNFSTRPAGPVTNRLK